MVHPMAVTLSATSQFLLKAPPPLCHPERPRISYFVALSAATYAALHKESGMKSTEATVFDRKSGAPRDLRCAPALAQRPKFCQFPHTLGRAGSHGQVRLAERPPC